MRILFYDDAAVFGGHEAMTLHAVTYLLQHTSETVIFVVAEANLRLRERLEQMQTRHPHLIVQTSPYHTASFQGFRTLLAPRKVSDVTRLLRAQSPDIVVLVQGGIEISSLGLLAARRARLPTISYIPYGHTMRLTGAALAAPRDAVNRYLYRCPDAYITISDSMADSLRAQGVRVPIQVVGNCISKRENDPAAPLPTRAHARASLGLSDAEWTMGIIGRVHLKHKNHDFLLRTLARHGERLGAWRLLVAGDGPDLSDLRQQIARLGLDAQVTCLPWSDDMDAVYAALDAVVIPSRFEGVPLVMLEALARGLPVLASDRDGMKDLLPSAWRFPVNDAQALMDTIMRARQHVPPTLTAHMQAVVSEQYNPDALGASFYHALSSHFRHYSASRMASRP